MLVNGRRHVPADILNNAVSPDVNSIPNDLIERVDIVTGGNSAIYGSDAIAGVVNFVLRQNYDGVQVRGQAGISRNKAAAATNILEMVGHQFRATAGATSRAWGICHRGSRLRLGRRTSCSGQPATSRSMTRPRGRA